MLKKLFGFHDIAVTGDMTVAALQHRFEESFGTQIRVYKPTAPLYGYHKLHSLPVGEESEAKLPAFFRELKDGYNRLADEAHQLGPRALGRLKREE